MVISLRTMKVGGDDWAMRLSTLPLRKDGCHVRYLIDADARDLLIGGDCDRCELADRTAEAVVTIHCRSQLPPIPQARPDESRIRPAPILAGD